ncbi:MAG TPA: hypothetical protein VMM12_12105 [Longimicrobiales bacterium]|nr:hypothetical protein [Longimicrobiales bacterium]
MTVFLAGAECPFTCVFCDLWRSTLDGPTPPGAVPAQVRAALQTASPLPERAGIKLYNASNFFDRRAVPPADDPALAELLAPFVRVTVECHPRLVGRRCFAFGERVGGRLEVAMGLETIHPGALPRLNKRMTLRDFEQAAAALVGAGLALRAFVLLSPPFVPSAEAVEWAVRSAAHAIGCGAGHVSLIPVRGGNGALEPLAQAGAFVPPTLAQLEEALGRALELGGAVITADLWDVERLARCPDCFLPRRDRLARMNLTGRREPPVRCERCATV